MLCSCTALLSQSSISPSTLLPQQPTSSSILTRRHESNLLNGEDDSLRWELSLEQKSNLYMSSRPEMSEYLDSLRSSAKTKGLKEEPYDPLWEQIRLEATASLSRNEEAGPLLYTGILSQRSLLRSVVTVVAHQIATELIPATAIKNLFLENLTPEDTRSISFDLVAACTRSASVENAMSAILYHQGFHALVCYRLGHRLWLAGRKGLAYYLQSIVSRIFSADIHPAAKMGLGIHLRTTAGVVIGETAVLGNDVSILEGVTLGGTGKESGDRHPKLSDGVTVQHGASILGNIPIGEGAIITSKSIVTKPVPPLAVFSGVPARFIKYRELTPDAFKSDMQRHLVKKYLTRWKAIAEGTMKAEDMP